MRQKYVLMGHLYSLCVEKLSCRKRFIHPLQQKIYVKWKPHSIYDKLCEEDGLFVVKKHCIIFVKA